MTGALDYHRAAALLVWQYELGATEAMLDAPLDRYALAAAAPVARPAAPPPPPAPAAEPADAAPQAAERAAGNAGDLAALEAALGAFDLCALKRGARSTVFADGRPGARVMVIGEAPDREEDGAGRPFTGAPGAMLDRMFAAIGLSRDDPDPARALYLVPALPWRLPHGREATAEDRAMLRPFLDRHVALAGPEILVLMGNAACALALGQSGLTRLRGQWATAFGRPALPMLHPAALIRDPAQKRAAWDDLLSLQARLRGQG